VDSVPVSITFDRFSVCRGAIAVLESLALPSTLAVLHHALGQRLESAGFATEARPYRPHVTLARRGVGAVADGPDPPITWQASSYALVESAGGRYTVLQEQLLRG
jgi:2'-5' RNA ligase